MNPTRRTFLKTAGAFFAGALSLPAAFIFTKPKAVPNPPIKAKRLAVPEKFITRNLQWDGGACRVCGERHEVTCCDDPATHEDMWNMLSREGCEQISPEQIELAQKDVRELSARMKSLGPSC